LEIVVAALDGPDGDGVGDQPGFQTSLDREQAAYTLQHQHS
jgi:hypothetical protein